MKDKKCKEYTLNDLKKDLKRLDRKMTNLSNWMEDSSRKEQIIDYLAKEEITEKLIMPVYIAKRIELYSRYFNLKGMNQSKVDL